MKIIFETSDLHLADVGNLTWTAKKQTATLHIVVLERDDAEASAKVAREAKDSDVDISHIDERGAGKEGGLCLG